MRCKPGWPPFGYFASSGGCITWLPQALAWKFAQHPACHFFLLSTVIAALLRPFFHFSATTQVLIQIFSTKH